MVAYLGLLLAHHACRQQKWAPIGQVMGIEDDRTETGNSRELQDCLHVSVKCHSFGSKV